MTNTAMSLTGRRVVVIGGATGIGFAIAELACELGATLVIGSRNEGNLSAAVEHLQGATGRTVDLRGEASVIGFFKEVRTLDHLAITAGDWGGPMFVSTPDIDLTQARDLLTVRFWDVLAAVKYGCRTIAQDGSLTLTGGLLAHRPRKGTPMSAAVVERSNSWPEASRWTSPRYG